MNTPGYQVRRSWRTALAGALAGATTSILLHPIDTAKTLRQASSRAVRAPLIPFLWRLLRERGIRAAYAGLAPAVIGSACSSALYFATYETVRSLVSGAQTSPRLLVNMLAAGTGNVVSSVLFVPKEVIKQRMQTGRFGSRLLPAVANMVSPKAGGWRSLYVGYRATLLRNIPSNALRFAIYEEIKIVFLRWHRRCGDRASRRRSEELAQHEHLVAASLAGVLASAATTPMDVLKTRFATADAGSSAAKMSLAQLGRHVIRTEGVSELFVGLRARMLWSALFSAIGLATYENFKRWVLAEVDRDAGRS